MPSVLARDGRYRALSSHGLVPQRGYQHAEPSNLSYLTGRLVSFDRLYREQPLVREVVQALAPQIARVPWRLYQRVDADTRRAVEPSEHRIAQLLAHPAPRRSPLDLKNDVVTGLMIHGNHAERIVRRRGGFLELHRLRWKWLQAWTYDDQVISWRYQPPDGPPVDLGPEEVIHWRWQAPDSPFGVSPLAQLGVTFRAEAAIQSYIEGFFRNGARIGNAVILEPGVPNSDGLRRTLKEEIKSNYTLDHVFSTAVFGGGVKDVKPFGAQTAVEAELIQQRQLDAAEVGGAYTLPPAVRGRLEGAKAEDLAGVIGVLYKHVAPPWMELITATLGAQLIETPSGAPDGGYYVGWMIKQILKSDPEAHYRAGKEAVHSGLVTLNEWRKDDDRTPYDQPIADKPLLPTGGLAPAEAATRAALESADVPVPAVDRQDEDAGTDDE
ncbi:MAG: phage portal protein [Solirubrobacteraceae bacterium]|nr:phage portal protein [Solirubrobacteraceae bacterium]